MMKSGVVCVTGASGYVASWLVKLLLERGYSVRASVRDLNDPKKTEHLLSFDGAKERLHLFEANLLEEGSFDPVVEGCVCVFHTASPFLNTVTNPQEEMIEPAVKGTINVLESCARTPSVKRVVVTSSFAAVVFNNRPLSPDVVVDETWFSDPILCQQFNLWYLLSKTLAEEAAWKFAKEKGIDLISINPGMVIGPLLQPTLNASAEEILVFLKGEETFSNKTMAWVHVRDVAEAHIRAFENPTANGRYLVVESVLHSSELAKIMKNLFPTYKIPKKCKVDQSRFKSTFQVSKEKAKSLGIDFIPIEVSLKETVESLKEKNLFNP